MKLERLTLSTRDLTKSRTFYSTKLGFPVVEEREGVAFVVDAGGVKLHVDLTETKTPLSQTEPRLLFNTSSLALKCAMLRDRGVSVEGPRRNDTGAYAELTDPDGHSITLCERN